MKNHLLHTIIFLFMCGGAFGQNYSWKQKANLPGIARLGAFSFSIDSLGYIGGGYSASGNNLSDFWEYHPSSNSWTQKSNLPLAIRVPGAFAINGKGYYTGGIIQSGAIVNNTYEYDPLANSWTIKASMPGVPRYGGASFSINGKGYYGIGNGGSATGPYYKDFYEYDPVADSWTQKASFPGTERYGTMGKSLNGKGYAGLGANEALGIFFNDFYEYNPVTDTWTAKSSLPGANRTYSAGFVINNKIYLGTGTNPTSTFDDFFEYNPVSNSWITVQNFPGGLRVVATAFSIGSIGYFGTGINGSNYYNDFYEYSPDITNAPIIALSSSDTSFCEKQCINFTDLSTNNPTSWKWFFPGADSSTSSLQNPTNICYKNYGSYDVTLIACNAAGCDTLHLTKFIKCFQNPTNSINQSNDTLYSLPAYTYQWFEITSGIIAGATNQYFVPQQGGSYYCLITDSVGCAGSSGTIIVSKINSFSINPNPFDNSITVTIHNSNISKVSLSIINVIGQAVYQQHIIDLSSNNKLIIDLSFLANGIYLLDATLDDNRYIQKIVKE